MRGLSAISSRLGRFFFSYDYFFLPFFIHFPRCFASSRTGAAGHWIPQYDYVYENRRKVVQHILRFENLKEEFSNLMDRYDLPLKLPEKPYRPSDTKKLGIYNLTRQNLEIIEKVYWQDFVEFGYEVLSYNTSE